MHALARHARTALGQTLLAAALALTGLLFVDLVDPAVAAAQDKLDLNDADAKDLARLPGLNKVLAERIVAYRNKNGPFKDVKDLLKVSGIQKRGFSKLAARLTVTTAEANTGDEDDERVKTLADAEENAPDKGAESNDAAGSPGLQRSNRMEFDGRLIKGQSAGAGAVFLFERAPRPLPSMVARRTSYLDDTVTAVLGNAPVLDDAPKSEASGPKGDDKSPPRDDKPSPRRRRPRR